MRLELVTALLIAGFLTVWVAVGSILVRHHRPHQR